MTCRGAGRSLAGRVMRPDVVGMAQGHPIHGRQGKSAASGRAHRVGRLELYEHLCDRASWRFSPKPQRFQRPDRHRCPPEPASAP